VVGSTLRSTVRCEQSRLCWVDGPILGNCGSSIRDGIMEHQTPILTDNKGSCRASQKLGSRDCIGSWFMGSQGSPVASRTSRSSRMICHFLGSATTHQVSPGPRGVCFWLIQRITISTWLRSVATHVQLHRQTSASRAALVTHQLLRPLTETCAESLRKTTNNRVRVWASAELPIP